LESYFDTYLLVARFVDDEILSYIEVTEGAAAQYQRLRGDISHVQIEFYLIFLGGAVLLVLAAVWAGYVFAAQLVQPVSKLMSATERIKKGDWQARVDISGPKNDELVILGKAFNAMADQLENQRDELLSAQRRSAWSDVARRIAHEIKNPLTPIQLSAERLKKKFAPLVIDEKDRKQFERYVTTISRNVGDIGQMVEEFANFARLPAPVFHRNDFVELLKDVVFSRRELTDHHINYISDIPAHSCMCEFDEHQLSRVLTNLLKNAEESVEERLKKDDDIAGEIHVSLRIGAEKLTVTILDNGMGFDRELLSRITEPYVTTKAKGTGLGLAIVKKIIEDHHGSLTFGNRDEGGARVVLVLVV
jgi:two-component system nitrogen regulation sensor histidine kinase NtrY